jgi:hypothetical protein
MAHKNDVTDGKGIVGSNIWDEVIAMLPSEGRLCAGNRTLCTSDY